MPFPAVESIIYKKNALIEVICQFRFPSILTIEAEVPSKFQERIRKDYPTLNENVEVQIKVAENSPSQLSELLSIDPSLIKHKNYEFISGNEQWKINLTSNFLSLSSIEYTSWKDLKNHLQEAFNSLVEIYQPPYFTRLGLRYKNIIRRSNFGFNDVPWSELIQPNILGIINSPEASKDIININQVAELKLDEQSTVRIINGFIHEGGNEETSYVIDSDFFTMNKMEISASIDKLDYLNDQGSRLFRWCITDKLHRAMEPQAK